MSEGKNKTGAKFSMYTVAIIYFADDNEDESDGEISDGMEDAEWNKKSKKGRPHDSGDNRPPSTQQKKLKPDESWIRSESIDNVDAKEGTEEQGAETEKLDTKDSEVTEVVENVETLGPCESSTDVDDSVNTETVEQYMRENIPWRSGTVLKTKQDIEGRNRDGASGGDQAEGIVILVEGEPYQGEGESRQSVALEGVTVTESSDGPETEMGEDSGVVVVGDGKQPVSVYEMEDIPLPAGIVRRTTKEIEERSQ